jgi:putative oxidoreductase
VRPIHAAHVRDAALLAARLVLGAVLAAHGHRTLVDGAGTTERGVEHVGVPVVVVLAAVVAVVELLGGLLLVAGLRTPVVAGTAMAAVGAATLVPGTRGGWELVAALVAALVALAVAGPGRWSGTHLVRRRRARGTARHRPSVARSPAPVPALGGEPIPPAGLPLIPLVRLSPTPVAAPRRPGVDP